ncbi:MAG: hypothetical protein HFF86_10725 [Oscillibacter sp.]|nr:hypothetical protein [Oscillibacter sp.]
MAGVPPPVSGACSALVCAWFLKYSAAGSFGRPARYDPLFQDPEGGWHIGRYL